MAIIGCVDFITANSVSGWAYSEDDPSEHLVIRVQVDGTDFASVVSDQYREDLKTEGVGDGDHAYSIEFSLPLESHEFELIAVFAESQDGDSAGLSVPPASLEEDDFESAISDRLSVVEQQLERCLRYGQTYAEAAELFPPAGLLMDFVHDTDIAMCAAKMQCDADEVWERIKRDIYPIPHPDNRERYAAEDHLGYWLSGYSDFSMLERIAGEYGVRSGRYLDFGGSTGRVFRNFAFQTDAWDVWSCDFKISSVEFNLKYFPSKVRVFLNASATSLPLPDSYFDMISACSVFTHIDETETAWLLELRRILKPGGIACISIHSKDTWKLMDLDLRDYVAKYRPDVADELELPEGKTVVTFRSDDPYRCQTFHSDDYIRRNWGRFFEICEIRPLTLGEQAMVVCRRVD